ncbi:MAG: ribosome biogenesis GTPase Der, partial [Candidatus Falkowbacteria bacterium]|nr:ribosome biogenesis GTPase Der [Candidatus Falkowbacteria bacterium]
NNQKIKTDDLEAKVQQQAKKYILAANLVLFLVDVRDGLLPPDRQMALLLKKLLPPNKKIILVANKVDNPNLRKEIAEFNKLSLGEPIPVSAANGSGTGDLLDEIIKNLKKTKSKKEAEPLTRGLASTVTNKTINVAIIGKPNVGKSSLVNAILGEEKIIVSPIPHTTREPHDTLIEYCGYEINLIDTAGISKQGQKSARQAKFLNTLEKLSISQSLKTITKAQVALLIIDLNEGISHQDAKLVEEIFAKKVSLIIVANKWDLIKERNTKLYTEKIYSHFPFCQWAPIQFISAFTGEKVQKVLDLIIEVAQARQTEVAENALGKFLHKIVKKHRPVKAKGTKHPHLSGFKQVGVNPPVFSLHLGSKDTIHFSYLRFIENRLREKFNFLGTPITIVIDQKKHIHGAHER